MTSGFIILDPGTTNVSDILPLVVTPGYFAGTTPYSVSFPSDAESPLTYTPIPSIDETITETGDFRTIYDRPDATGENPNFTIRYPSDVEPTGNVPEPASLALGLAFAGRISLATAQAALTRSDKQDKKTKTKPES